MLNKVYSCYVNGQYILSSEMCESTEEFIDFYIAMIADFFEVDEEANMVAEKLQNRDFTVELDSDGEVDYVNIMVTM